MQQKVIKDDIVSLLEKIIERAHRINRQQFTAEHLLDIDLVKDDIRTLYRCFDMLARLSRLPDSARATAGDDESPCHSDRPAQDGEQSLQQTEEATAHQPGTTPPAQSPPPARHDAPAAEASLAPEPSVSAQSGKEPVRLETTSPFEQDTPAAETSVRSAPAASPRDESEPGRPGTSPPAERDSPATKAANTSEPAGSSKDEPGQLIPPASSQAPQDSGESGPSAPIRPDEPMKTEPRQMVIPVPDDQWESGKGRQEPGQQTGEKGKGKKNNNGQKAVIDILSEYSQRTIGDQYLKEKDDSLHQRIAGQKEDRSIGAQMQRHPVGDLKDVIGVNEKFLFINELFGGDIQDYRKAIADLNGMDGVRQAFEYLNKLAMEHSWDAARSSSTIEKLANYVQRRHMSRD